MNGNAFVNGIYRTRRREQKLPRWNFYAQKKKQVKIDEEKEKATADAIEWKKSPTQTMNLLFD